VPAYENDRRNWKNKHGAAIGDESDQLQVRDMFGLDQPDEYRGGFFVMKSSDEPLAKSNGAAERAKQVAGR